MSDGDDCGLGKFWLDQILDLLLSLEVYVSCCFVQNHDLWVSKHGTAEADQLSLTWAEILPTVLDFLLKATSPTPHHEREVTFFEGYHYLLIFKFPIWIEVEPQSAGEKGWILRNYRDQLSQLLQWHLRNLTAIDQNLTFEKLYNSIDG